MLVASTAVAIFLDPAMQLGLVWAWGKCCHQNVQLGWFAVTRSAYSAVQCSVSTGGLAGAAALLGLAVVALGAVEMVSYDLGFPNGALSGTIAWLQACVFLRVSRAD